MGVIWEAETMHETSDWGRPMAPPDWVTRERITARLPHGLIRVLRSRARAQGIPLNVLLDRLLHQALAMTTEPPEQADARVAAAE